MSAIVRKSLKLSNSARQKFTTGEITNLISVDTQRLLDNIPYLNVLWGAPLKIVVAMVLIYRELGKKKKIILNIFFNYLKKYTLFRNSGCVVKLIVKRNASKFTIFYIYENPKLLYPFFISCLDLFSPYECPGLCRHRPGHS